MLLEKHNTFQTTRTRIKLIGLIENERINDLQERKYIYAPFGKPINERHKGIYLCNNKNIKKWMETKGDIEKMLRDVTESLKVAETNYEDSYMYTSQRLKGKLLS